MISLCYRLKMGDFTIKKLFILPLFAAVLCACSAVGAKFDDFFFGKTAASAVQNEDVSLIFSTTHPADSPLGRAQAQMAAELKSISFGTVEVSCYNGELFPQSGEITALGVGDCDLAYLTPSQLAEGSPWMATLGADGLFYSYDHLYRTLCGEAGEIISQRIHDEQDLVVLGYCYGGQSVLACSLNLEITSPEDLLELYLAITSDSDSDWCYLMNMKPLTPKTSDVLLELDPYRADMVIWPLSDSRLASAEGLRAINCIPVYTQLYLLVAGADAWDRMTEEQRGWVEQAAQNAVNGCNSDVLSDEESVISLITDADIPVYQNDPGPFCNVMLSDWLASAPDESVDSTLLELAEQARTAQ